LSFWWKVSSEGSYDFLEFYVDGVRQHRISGSVGWQQMSYEIPSGSHTLEWRYTKDISVSSGSDCGWVDKVEWTAGGESPPSPPSSGLSDALDTTLSFTTGGDANWLYQNTTYHHDGDAAQSGGVSDGENTWMETTVTGPSTVKFYWKVSSENNYDFLVFYVDDTVQDRISGIVGWQQMTYNIPSGSHILGWGYIKDGSVSTNRDCGWVDWLELTPGG
jgi:hypothetical protein